MKLFQLEYFQSVCKLNSFTRAAKELHVSQPSISNAIRALEVEFGVTLLHRFNRQISLTKEGEYLLKHSDDILNRISMLEEQMSNMSNDSRNIRIGIPPMIGSFIFPRMFKEFRTAHPNIHLEISETGSLKTIEQVRDDFLDMAIIITSLASLSQFNVLNLFDTEIVWCANPLHPYSRNSEISIPELSKEPLVLMREGSFQNTLINKLFVQSEIDPNVILYSNQLNILKSFISENIASGFLIKDVVLNDKNIVGIPIKEPLIISIGLIWKKNEMLHNNAVKFIRFCQKYNYPLSE